MPKRSKREKRVKAWAFFRETSDGPKITAFEEQFVANVEAVHETKRIAFPVTITFSLPKTRRGR